MLAYPQMETGALGQFPIRKLRQMRTVSNATADGRFFKFADPAAEVTQWELEYYALTDTEAATLSRFFDSVEGRLLGFTFLDPTANLLAWSNRLDESVWERDPFVSLAGDLTDPCCGTAAWRVSNGGAAPQSIWQTLAAPGRYTYCFSAYVRAPEVTDVTLLIGERRVNAAARPTWSRVCASVSDNPESEWVRFGIETPAGRSVEVFGMQAETQAGASVYKPTMGGGVYKNARFLDDELRITTTGINRNTCRVTIIHANHL